MPGLHERQVVGIGDAVDVDVEGLDVHRVLVELVVPSENELAMRLP
jgi:hypothetical protein